MTPTVVPAVTPTATPVVPEAHVPTADAPPDPVRARGDQQMLPMGEETEPAAADDAAIEDEFTPTSDEGARQRRVRGRRAKRAPGPAGAGPTEPEPGPTEPEPTEPEPKPAEASTPPRTKQEQTKDDTDLGWGEQHEELAYDRWLREQRPPHWGSD